MATRRALKPAAAVPFRRVEGLPEDIQRLQRATEESTLKARQDQGTRSVLVTVEMPAAGNVQVKHKLGRKPEKVETGKVTGAAPSFFEYRERTSRTLFFTSASACTVELVVS